VKTPAKATGWVEYKGEWCEVVKEVGEKQMVVRLPNGNTQTVNVSSVVKEEREEYDAEGKKRKVRRKQQ
jgi:hypothetical protein